MEIEDTANKDITPKSEPPYANDPGYQKAMDAQSRVSKMLEKHGFESIDELNEIVEEGNSLSAMLGGRDAKKLIKDSEKLREYEEAWKLEDEKRRREEEDPEDTIERQKQELEDVKKAHEAEKQQREADRLTKKYMRDFNDTIKSVVKASDLPKAYHKHALTYMGVDNPAMEVDISKPSQVKKTAKESVKALEAFAQTVIEQYKKGKQDIPKVPGKSAETTTTDEKTPKGFKGARAALQEQLGRWRA